MRTLLLCLLLLTAAWGQTPSPAPAKGDVLKALQAFHAYPLAPLPNEHQRIIMAYALESSDVQMSIGPKECPWVTEKPESDWQSVLLAAYIAGNVEAQLKAGKPGDQPGAGLTQVSEVYAKIRAKDPKYRSPGLEKLISRRAGPGS